VWGGGSGFNSDSTTGRGLRKESRPIKGVERKKKLMRRMLMSKAAAITYLYLYHLILQTPLSISKLPEFAIMKASKVWKECSDGSRYKTRKRYIFKVKKALIVATMCS
jgi:hypothetical protein